MNLKILSLLSVCLPLLSCGGPQPSGSLDSCLGTLAYSEQGNATLQQRTVTDIHQVGQYLNITKGIVADSLMIKAQMNGVTQIEIVIYKLGLEDLIDRNTIPLSTMTTQDFGTVAGTNEHWLKLPQPFEFQSRSDGDISRQYYYFVTLRALDGNFTVDVKARRSDASLLAGFRLGSPISWASTSENLSVAMGLRGESNCQFTSEQ